jgi:hypothetical protein
MKPRFTLLLFVIALLVVGSRFQLSAQDTKSKSVKAADPHVGTWKLNIAQSKGPAVPKEETNTVRELGDQYEVTFTGIQKDDSPISAKYTLPQIGGALKRQPDFPEGVSAFVTVINQRDWYTTGLQDGKQVTAIHYVISKDGKTMTETINGTDAKGKHYEALNIWDKQ